MKPQETAQERAEKYERGLPTNMKEGGMYFACQIREAFIAGEESGERITLERLAADAEKDFDDWYKSGMPLDLYEMKRAHDIYYKYAKELCIERTKIWIKKHNDLTVKLKQSESTQGSLLAKIELLEKQLKYVDEMGAHLSATQCVHSEALTIREGQDGITCAKQERIKSLESALIDMAKALEYMDNLPRGATTDRGYKALVKYESLINDLIKDGK